MRKILSVLSFVLLFSIVALGQATAGLGTIAGSVRDATGAPVPGAKVVVANPQKGITREFTTTDSGLFTAPALVPSDGYKLTVTKAGFGTYEATELVLQVGSNLDMHVVLKVGAVAEKVEVIAAAPIVDDAKTEVSAVVDNKMINDLPINGRRVDQFVLLTPAVVKDADFGLVSFRGVAGGNSFLVDGNDTTNQYYNENAGRTRLGSQLSQDAVQEFQVLTSSFAAEFGRASGGVVNTVTKSGTNSFHGTAFWFFRNRTLDARDRFAQINPPEVRHQTGATLGGPIKKDKLFVFFDAEYQYRHFPLVSNIINNNVNAATQTWNGCSTTGTGAATVAQCAAINGLLPRFFGLVDRNGNQSLYFLKTDYRPNDRNSVSLSFNYLHWQSMNGIQTGTVNSSGGGVGNNGDDSVRDRIARASWTWVPTNAIVNEARFGWFKDRQADDFNQSIEAGYPIGLTGLSVAGVSTLGGYNILPRILPSENRFQYVDNLSWTRGRHTMKFGVDVARTEDFANSLSNRFGTFTYNTVTAFALDYSNSTGANAGKNWSSYSQLFGNPIVDTKVTDIGFFAQDTWKVNSRFTANYGIRYEYSFIPQPTLTNPAYPQTGHIPSAPGNIAPRIGLAYSINDKTVFRVGYGLFFARYPTSNISTFFTNNNIYTQNQTFQTPTQAGAPVYPIRLASGGVIGVGNLSLAAPDMRNPYSEQIDVGLERSLGKTVTLTVSYIMNRGKRLFTVRDLNVGAPGGTATYNFVDANYAPTGQSYSTPIYIAANRVDKNYVRVNQVENGGKSWYDAMAVQLNKRFKYGFSGTVAYTWSHALDENQFGGSSAIFFSGGPSSLFPGAYLGDKGNGNLDQRQRFVGTFQAHPKFTKSNNAFAKYVVNNWELTGLLTLASARPSFESVSLNNTTGLPALAATNTLNGYGGDTRVPWLQINPLRLDPITRFDSRISKVFPIKEQMKLTLSFEAFNITNTVSNTSVLSQGFAAGNRGTAAAPNFVIAPCTSVTTATCTALTPGVGTASAGFPDGTNARRAQVSARFVF